MADDTNAREALKPCPFCGAQLDSHDILSDDIVECPSCFVRNFSVDEWNRRATPADRGAPAEGAMPDEARERELFEANRKEMGVTLNECRIDDEHPHARYVVYETQLKWEGWLARARLADPTSQAGRDALDAARYRFLREDPPHWLAVRKITPGGSFAYFDGDNLDRAIDAALASSAQAGQGEQG